MIGPGTGIAPFRSFWQQRICDDVEDGSKRNDMMMFFGCRHPHHDDIYATELQEAKNVGALTNVFTAYSRHPNQPKVSSISFTGMLPFSVFYTYYYFFLKAHLFQKVLCKIDPDAFSVLYTRK